MGDGGIVLTILSILVVAGILFIGYGAFVVAGKYDKQAEHDFEKFMADKENKDDN